MSYSILSEIGIHLLHLRHHAHDLRVIAKYRLLHELILIPLVAQEPNRVGVIALAVRFKLCHPFMHCHLTLDVELCEECVDRLVAASDVFRDVVLEIELLDRACLHPRSHAPLYLFQ